MRNRNFGFVIAILAAVLSLWAYPRMPDIVTTHWNLRGEPDGSSSRLFAASVLPLLLAGLPVLFRLLPRIDPKGENYAAFNDTYWRIANTVIVFLFGAHAVLLWQAMGRALDIRLAGSLGAGGLIMVLGNYLGRVRPNWFVGVRTPWTLSSETVWRKTHRTAGWLFVLAGAAIAGSAFLPSGATPSFLLWVIAPAALIPVVQSYILWRKERNLAR